jgi:CcmD family protein
MLVILSAVLVIWLGVFVYLMSLDRKVSRLTRERDQRESQS